MATAQMSTIVQTCTVFYESLPHLNAENRELTENSVELVAFLSEQYPSGRVRKLRQAYEKAVTSQSEEVLKAALAWFQEINVQMAQDFAKRQKEEGLNIETALEYFAYILKAQLSFGEMYAALFENLHSYAYLLPELCFAIHMQFLKKNPRALAQILPKVVPHYEYSETHEQTEIETCPVCGGKGEGYFMALSCRMADFSPPNLPFKLWMKCTGCHNLYSRYMAKYLLDMTLKSEYIEPYATPEMKRTPHTPTFVTWCNILKEIQKINGAKDVLEVGTGNGSFLATALEMGLSVEAVELSRDSAQSTANLLGIGIMSEDFLCFEPKKQYDAIFMGDVIEHITNPKKALQKVQALLKENGVLWLSTPNFESAFSRFTKFDDPMWCVHDHITYFSYKTLTKLLCDEGFKVLEYTVSNRYNGSMELIIQKSEQ